MVPLTRKIYFISICVLCIVIVLLLLWEINDGNAKLMWNEIKAYFKPGISLEFHPDIESIESIEIAGVTSSTITTNLAGNQRKSSILRERKYRTANQLFKQS